MRHRLANNPIESQCLCAYARRKYIQPWDLGRAAATHIALSCHHVLAQCNAGQHSLSCINPKSDSQAFEYRSGSWDMQATCDPNCTNTK
eukprot:90250-Amphidinium_carterae.1